MRLIFAEFALVFISANVLFVERVFTENKTGVTPQDKVVTFLALLLAGFLLVRNYTLITLGMIILGGALEYRYLKYYLDKAPKLKEIEHKASFKYYWKIYLYDFLAPLGKVLLYVSPTLIAILLISYLDL